MDNKEIVEIASNEYVKAALDSIFLEKYRKEGYCLLSIDAFTTRKDILRKRVSQDNKILDRNNPQKFEELIEAIWEIKTSIEKLTYNDKISIIYMLFELDKLEKGFIRKLVAHILDKDDLHYEGQLLIKIGYKVVKLTLNNILNTLYDYDNSHYSIYRGHSDINFQCIPSLYRSNKWKDNEANMQNEVKWLCPEEFKGRDYLSSLTKFQHYGLPTRLLDFTTNYLVALYFACEDTGCTGEIIRCSIKNSDVVYDYDDTDNTDDTEYGSQCVCIKPAYDNRRILNQEGVFLRANKNSDIEDITTYIGNARYQESEEKIIYLIESKKKGEIRKFLETVGINKAKLFPELADVANYVKDKYK